MSRPRIVVVTGPTASGKTEFAIELAAALGGEIVSADSMQVYRHLDIGTAKPTPGQRARVPHHLVNVADPDETYHAGRFRHEATHAIDDILGRGRVAVVAGGTPLYLKILLHGLAPGPGRDQRLRDELAARWEAGERCALWRELANADPVLAARVHWNDRSRVIRGLEVWRLTGRPLSRMQQGHRFTDRAYHALRLGMDVERQELYTRINQRVVRMVAAGWVEEVQRVLAMGYPPEVPPLQALGYREISAHVRHGGEFASVVAEIQRLTRRFAKRQMTWFRSMELEWVNAQEPDVGITRAKKFLQTP